MAGRCPKTGDLPVRCRAGEKAPGGYPSTITRSRARQQPGDRAVLLRAGDGGGAPVEGVATRAATGFQHRHHHRKRLTSRVRFRAEAQLAEDHHLPQRLLGGVVRRAHTIGMVEHEQAAALVAQPAVTPSPCTAAT